MAVTLLAGTEKGGFLLRSDPKRARWTVEGPLFKGWKVTAAQPAGGGRFLAATSSYVYGAAVHASEDLESWRHIETGPSWPEDTGRKMNQIWTLVAAGDRLYAGVDEAGLFRSADGGESWEPLLGLERHPTRAAWFPGNGGLCAHSVLVDPARLQRIWCAISAVGVFRSDDDGESWRPVNDGVPAVVPDEKHADIGRCPHALAASPEDAGVIYRREHVGMYRTQDGGDTWETVGTDLPSRFGFPLARARRSGALFTVPLESDEYRMPAGGRLVVYRSHDGGSSWAPLQQGLPQEHAHMGVLRGAMTTDDLDPAGVYLGTTSGTIHVSRDGGESWQQPDCVLPRILSLTVLEQS